jgi:hypothetical protein
MKYTLQFAFTYRFSYYFGEADRLAAPEASGRRMRWMK